MIGGVRPKPGRPSDRPSSRSSILGHPGASSQSVGLVFLLPPGLPPPTTALGGGGLLTLTLRGKAMDGLEAQQERNRPQLSHRAWKTGPTEAGLPQAPTGRRRSVAGCSLGLFSSPRTEHTIDGSRTLATQSTRPPNRGSFMELEVEAEAPTLGTHADARDNRDAITPVEMT